MTDEKKPETALTLPSAAPGVLAITGGSTPMPAPEEFMALTNAAAWIFRSRAFPQYQSAEGVFVGMLYLREMGVNLTMGLSKGYVVKGKFDVEAKVKLASIKSRVPTFEYSFPVSSDERCVFRARLSPSDPWTEREYTIERARAAGLTVSRSSGKEEPEAAWQANRQEMLQWRAISRWLNMYAGHVIYTLGGLVARDAMEVQEAVEVVEESVGVAPLVPASAAPPVPARVPPPEALPDWKAEWLRLAKKQGKPTGKGSAPALLAFANGLMSAIGRTQVRSSSELSIVDYMDMVKEMQRRGWDTAAQKDTPAPPEYIKGFDEQPVEADAEVERPVGLSRHDWAPPPSAAYVKSLAAPEPAAEPEPMELTAASGDVSAIIALGCKLTTVMKAQADIVRTFVQEWAPESGNWWFVDQDILAACGGSTIVEGKPTVNTVLLETQSPEDKDQEASEALRQMLGQKLVETQSEFEARTRGPKNVMGARSQAALETSRRGK